MKQSKIELSAVFTKETELQTATAILEKTGVPFRKGMDSSRGKLYFYKTGPKFILTFPSEEEKLKTRNNLKELKEIYELYTPDWDKCKD